MKEKKEEEASPIYATFKVRNFLSDFLFYFYFICYDLFYTVIVIDTCLVFNSKREEFPFCSFSYVNRFKCFVLFLIDWKNGNIFISFYGDWYEYEILFN